ncbi:PE family protein [Nocardia sp. NPDC050710]|uniref:PE family protein n=1 Tax=Nocardia sp. NPDC050710 TaxID=3157220 RepID=UPI0033ECCBC6
MARGGVDFEGVQFDPKAARDAALRLDGLADRLEQGVRDGENPLQVAPAGTDEVSLRAAQTMTDVATSYLAGADSGIHELRKLAAQLRSQVDQFGRAESESVTDFGGAGGAS